MQATAIYYAAVEGHEGCVQALLDAGATVDAPTNRGWTPLIGASSRNHVACMQRLLDGGADCERTALLEINASRTPDITALFLACFQGHTYVAQCLSSYGAKRTFGSGELGIDWSAEFICAQREHAYTQREHASLAEWLRRSQGWTPLHHLEVLSPARTRALLRDGANVHARPTEGVERKTPVERADELFEGRTEAAKQALVDRGPAGLGHVIELVRRAAGPWSPRSHDLFAAAERARAVELLCVGYHLAAQPRFGGEAQALIDVWVSHVMSHAVRRPLFDSPDADPSARRLT